MMKEVSDNKKKTRLKGIKKNRRNNGKGIQKPKFPVYYFESLLVLLAFFLCIGAGVFYYQLQAYRNEFTLAYSTYFTELDGILGASFDKEKITPADITDVKISLVNHYAKTGQHVKARYDHKDVADASQTAIMHYNGTGFELADLSYLDYFKTDELLPYWDTEYEKEYTPKEPDQVLGFSCSEAYIDFENLKFIPVVCEIYTYMDWTSTGKTVSIPIEKGSVSVEEYTHVKIDAPEYALGKIAGFVGEERVYDVGHWSILNSYGIYYGGKEDEVPETPFKECYRNEIRTAVVAGVLAVCILSLLPSTVLYNKKRRDYEIYEYRRRLTDAMAHDLKTPMTAIATYAENMENDTREERRSYYAARISEKVWQMNKIVNVFLEFSKSENLVGLNEEEIDIGEVISACITDHEPSVKQKALKVHFTDKKIRYVTDRELFAQAIGNLINNAVQYAKEGSTIQIECDERGMSIVNETAEKVENAERLREPFVKGTESRKHYGTGLGLAIADNNLKMLGYEMDIKVEDEKFYVTIMVPVRGDRFKMINSR